MLLHGLVRRHTTRIERKKTGQRKDFQHFKSFHCLCAGAAIVNSAGAGVGFVACVACSLVNRKWNSMHLNVVDGNSKKQQKKK